ncbi:MAG: tyrosine-type recombinase/integrase [Alphaproteobacteria bacterium]|nr:tyrosine-type recombinase/integrase [Alphaproteobacteria bacterium]
MEEQNKYSIGDGWFIVKVPNRDWRVEYKHPMTGQRKKTSLRTKELPIALRDGSEMKMKLLAQKYAGFGIAKSFKEVVEEYINEFNPPKYNIDTIRRHIIPFFCGVLGFPEKSNNFSLLETGDIRAYQNWRRNNGMKESTIRRECDVISALIKVALEKGYDNKSKPLKIPTLKVVANTRDAFKINEVEELLLKAYSNFKNARHARIKESRRVLFTYLIFLVETGMRPGDALKLTWREMYLDENVPYFKINAYKNKNKKNKLIPISENLKNFLSNIKKLQKEFCSTNKINFSDDYSIFSHCCAYSEATISSYQKKGKVAPNAKIISVGEVKKSFRALLCSCDFYNADTCKNKLTLYSARHFKATQLKLSNLDDSFVAGMLSTSERMIKRHYDHNDMTDYKDKLQLIWKTNNIVCQIMNNTEQETN